jgi:hypothetical protein
LNVANTAAAPAVNASELVAGSVSIEFAALAVVPMTCRSDSPASFLFPFAPWGFEGVPDALLKGELEGVVRRVQGVLIRGFAGVWIAMLVFAWKNGAFVVVRLMFRLLCLVKPVPVRVLAVVAT